MAVDTAEQPGPDAGSDDYREVSRLAVGGLLLGLVAPLVLVFPLMLPVTIVGVVVSAWGLWNIYRHEQTGRRAALIGLALCLFFGSFSPAYRYTRQQAIYAASRPFVEKWMDLVQSGKKFDAFEMYLEESDRQPDGTNLDEYYSKHDHARKGVDNFFAESPVKQLLEAGESGSVTFKGGGGIEYAEGVEFVRLYYNLRYRTDGGRVNEVPILFVLIRSQDGRRVHWEFEDVVQPRTF